MHFPFACVMFAALIPYLAKLVMTVAMARAGNYDNHNPRDQQATLTGWKRRAIAAQLNGFEAFPIFAAGVLMAEITQANGDVVDGLCAAFVVLRVAYTILYITDHARWRSKVWFASLLVLGILGGLSVF